MSTLTIRSLRKNFGAVEVLKGIDLEAQNGEFIALVGPSGCGKSTLLAMIAGLESVTSGEIRIDGAGFWRIFRKIILPLSSPILIVTVIWQFTGIWNEYLFGVVFTSGQQQPITAALVALTASGTNVRAYDVMSAAVLIGALPPLLIYLFGGKYFVRGLTQGAIK